jgi:hypothetical protein
MIKLAVMRTATGKEDPELPLLQRRPLQKETNNKRKLAWAMKQEQ